MPPRCPDCDKPMSYDPEIFRFRCGCEPEHRWDPREYPEGWSPAQYAIVNWRDFEPVLATARLGIAEADARDLTIAEQRELLDWCRARAAEYQEQEDRRDSDEEETA